MLKALSGLLIGLYSDEKLGDLRIRQAGKPNVRQQMTYLIKNLIIKKKRSNEDGIYRI